MRTLRHGIDQCSPPARPPCRPPDPEAWPEGQGPCWPETAWTGLGGGGGGLERPPGQSRPMQANAGRSRPVQAIIPQEAIYLYKGIHFPEVIGLVHQYLQPGK